MKEIKLVIVSVILWGLSPAAIAQIPVTDVANLASQLQQAITTITQLQQQYEDFTQQIEQYEQQIKEYESLSGSYGVGDLYSGADAETYAPGTWEASLAILEQGGSPANADDVAAYARDYQDNYAFETGQHVYASESGEQAAYGFNQQAKSTRAALSISRAAYNKTGERLERIQAYLDKIDDATDLKEAVDLNNRLQVELSQAVLEQNRLMAVQMQLGGTQGAQKARETQTNAGLFRFKAEQ